MAHRSERADLLFEFCVQSEAVSWRAGSKGPRRKERLLAWQASVRKAAFRVSSGHSALTEAVDVEVIEFSEKRRTDRDNMAKPILDALQGILYEDDRQIARLHVEWYDIDGVFRVRFIPMVVASSLSRGASFVWVRVLHHRPSITLGR